MQRHGGDILTAAQKSGFSAGEILDFSASIVPFDMPQPVRKAINASITMLGQYPDPQCRALKEAVSLAEGISQKHIVCGNGAAELIFSLVKAVGPKRALVVCPTFSEYEAALRSVGCKVTRHFLRAENQFAFTDAVLEKLVSGIGMAVLCSPNNPTGNKIDGGLLLQILKKCRQNSIVLLLDTCFDDFTLARHPVQLTGQYRELFMLKSLTKLYAMPGLRIGYGVTSNTDIIRKMEQSVQNWNVNTIAQAAGIAAVGDAAHRDGIAEWLPAERERLRRQLEDCGFICFPPAANFILFYAKGLCNLDERLLARGILIRSCAQFAGLADGYFRVSVRLPEENGRLVRAIRQALSVKK